MESVQEVDVVDDLAAHEGVVGPEVARKRLFEPVDLRAHPPLAISARTLGHGWPAISASMIVREDTPKPGRPPR